MMEAFTTNHWAIIGLAFLLGLLVGLLFVAGGKWKGRYREEVRRREELEAENERLRREAREMDSLRHSAAKAPGRSPDPETERGPL